MTVVLIKGGNPDADARSSRAPGEREGRDLQAEEDCQQRQELGERQGADFPVRLQKEPTLPMP